MVIQRPKRQVTYGENHSHQPSQQPDGEDDFRDAATLEVAGSVPDLGYQSTLETSPEKQLSTPDTTLASTLIVTPQNRGTVSQLLSEMGQQSFSSTRQLNSQAKEHGGRGGGGGGGGSPTKSPKSPAKSPTKSFKAPEFNFSPKQEPPGTLPGSPKRTSPRSSRMLDTLLSPPKNKGEEGQAASQAQPTMQQPLRHHIISKPAPTSASAATMAKPKRSPPRESSHLPLVLGSLRIPVRDLLGGFSPRPATTVSPKEVVRVELKATINILRPLSFIRLAEDGGAVVKGRIDSSQKGVLLFIPSQPLHSGTSYTVTLVGDHAEVMDADALKDFSWNFFVI